MESSVLNIDIIMIALIAFKLQPNLLISNVRIMPSINSFISKQPSRVVSNSAYNNSLLCLSLLLSRIGNLLLIL